MWARALPHGRAHFYRPSENAIKNLMGTDTDVKHANENQDNSAPGLTINWDRAGDSNSLHHSGSGKHHHHHRRRSLKRTLMIIVLTLIVILVSLFVIWRMVDAAGRKALYQEKRESAPVLVQLPEEEVEKISEETITQQPQIEVENWEEGWIRYKGNIYAYNQDILNFLIMGIDAKGTVQPAKDYISGGQADGLYLAVINPDINKVSLVAINRNTMVPMDVYDAAGNLLGKYNEQICLAHGYGDGKQLSCESQEKVVSELFYNLPIHGYLAMNMGGIIALNDAIGGVTVPEMIYENGEIIYGENITVLGNDAYSYIRKRGKDFDSASYRLEKQKEYLRAFGQKALAEVKKNPAKAVDLYNAILPYVVTDLDISKITYLSGQASQYSLNSTIYSLQGNVELNEDTGYEEFYHDERQLYDMMIELFYKRVE